jgi:hypothetical protein
LIIKALVLSSTAPLTELFNLFSHFIAETFLKTGPGVEKNDFFKNVLQSYIWSSFVELDKLYPNVCRIRSETVRLRSYDRPRSEQKRLRIKKYFGDILAHPGSIFFFLNVSNSQAYSKYVPNYWFQCKGRPIARLKSYK